MCAYDARSYATRKNPKQNPPQKQNPKQTPAQHGGDEQKSSQRTTKKNYFPNKNVPAV